MKILFVSGSPRCNGVSAKVGNLFLDGLKKGGAEILEFGISQKKVKDCMGCFACSAGFGRRGKCVIDDDMKVALDFLDSADALVCVSPVYFYGMSSQMKRFFDRCFPFVRGYRFDEESGRMLNETGFALKRKKFVSISVGSGRLDDVFDAISHTYKMISAAMGFEYCAEILRGESAYFAMRELGSVRVRKVLSAFGRAGEIFAKTSSIPEQLVNEMQMPLSRGRVSFAKNAQIFWRLRQNGTPFESSEMISDVRILLREMCGMYNPASSPKKALIKFVFPDKNWIYNIKIGAGKCELSEGECAEPEDVKIEVESSAWAAVMGARENIGRLMLCGRLKISGDKSFFTAMKKMFSFGSDRRV